MESKEVEEAVWEALEIVMSWDRAGLWISAHLAQDLNSARLVDDLHIDSDALSFDFILDLEEKLNVNIPDKEWNNVYTVQDAIDLLKKYRNEELNL